MRQFKGLSLIGFRFYLESFVGRDFEGEAEVELVAGGWGGQEKVVGEAGQILCRSRGAAGYAGG